MSEREVRKIAARFRRDMEKLGLGVRIKAGDGPWIRITESRRAAASKAQDTQGTPGGVQESGEQEKGMPSS